MSQAVAVAERVAGGKRGALFGGALTDEALDSSRGVLGTTRNGDIRGLQQFYTPPEAAEFIKQVLDPLGRLPVLDPTAGNGALPRARAPSPSVRIPVIVLSSRTTQRDLLRAFEAGADDFLSRPVRYLELRGLDFNSGAFPDFNSLSREAVRL